MTTRLSRGGPPPALLHPPRAKRHWRTPSGEAWWDGERLFTWGPAASPSSGPAASPPSGPAASPSWGPAASPAQGFVDVVRREDVEVPWDDVPADVSALPDGAIESRQRRTSPDGVVAWTSEGWLYRKDGDVRCVGKAGPFLVGPRGALVVGDAGDEPRWTHAAAPKRSVIPLPVPFDRAGWGVRFSDDGRTLAGVDDGGRSVRIDLVSGRVEALAGLPVDGDGNVLPDDVREASWALRGALLAGPGGVVWDLRTGRRRFEGPVVRLGATVATGSAWATVAWDTGEGVWFDPSTGDVVGRFRVPLDGDETVLGGVPADDLPADGVVLRTSDGRGFRVDGAEVVETEEPAPVRPPIRGDGFRVGRGGIDVGGVRWDVPVEAAVRVGDVVWAWSTAGLLVALPA